MILKKKTSGIASNFFSRLASLFTRNSSKYEWNTISSTKIGKGSFGTVYKVTQEQKDANGSTLKTRIIANKTFNYPTQACNSRGELLQDRLKGNKYFVKLIEARDEEEATVDIGQCSKSIESQRPILGELDQEFFDGKTLCSCIIKKGFTSTDLNKIRDKVMKAVGFMHKKNVIHRDIKFDNILCKKEDNGEWAVKIIDFGEAQDVKGMEKSVKERQFALEKRSTSEMFSEEGFRLQKEEALLLSE